MSVNKVNQSTGELSPIAGGTLYADMAVGTIVPYGGSTAPDGFLLCQGQSLLRTEYAELFAVIGTSFGSVDDTHFNVPDLRESTVKGTGLTSKSSNHIDADGLSLGEFIDDRLQDHTHIARWSVHGQSGSNVNIPGSEDSIYTNGTIKTGRYGNTTEVKAIGVNFIIKATSIALPSDFASAVDDKINKAINPTLISLTSVTQSIPNSQTYLNQNIFTIPSNTKRVFFCLAGSGNIGGFVELIKGVQGYARDFNNITEALVSWTNNNVINISYIYNHSGAAKDVTFQCKYLA